jgi:hypothetical protein
MHFTMKREDWQTMKMIQNHNDSFKFKVENFQNWTVVAISLIGFIMVIKVLAWLFVYYLIYRLFKNDYVEFKAIVCIIKLESNISNLGQTTMICTRKIIDCIFQINWSTNF